MSIIEGLRTYLTGYTALKTGAPLWVDYLGAAPTEYAIAPMPGAKVVESYLNGNSLREYPFAFQSVESTADDPARLANIGFFEAFADWLDSQTAAGTLPTLGSKQTAYSIEAVNWGYLFQQGDSETGVYQIQCKLTYEQEA